PRAAAPHSLRREGLAVDQYEVIGGAQRAIWPCRNDRDATLPAVQRIGLAPWIGMELSQILRDELFEAGREPSNMRSIRLQAVRERFQFDRRHALGIGAGGHGVIPKGSRCAERKT